MPTVFISYNWSDSDFVDCIEKSLTGKAEVVRDKKNIPAWGSITNFMKKIRQQDFAVLVISDEYLKSSACLYEVVLLMKDEGWTEKTMYVVLNQSIYDFHTRAEYIRFWEQKCFKQEQEIKKLSPSNASNLIEDLKKSKTIGQNIGDFLTMVVDANNPPAETAIAEILKRVSGGNQSTEIVSDRGVRLSPLPVTSNFVKIELVHPYLSKDALSLLFSAYNHPNGEIYMCHTVLGLSVKANGHEFMQSGGRREEVRWESAVSELEDNGLVEITTHDRHSCQYKLTKEGYDMVDEMKQKTNEER